MLGRSRPEAPQLGRWPGQRDRHPPLAFEQDPGRGAGKAEGDRAGRKAGLLAHACREVGVRPSEALREAAGDPLDLPLEVGVDAKLDARHLREQLDGAVVVGRTEAARCDADVRLERLAQRSLELGRPVPDDDHARRLDSEAPELAGDERAVRVAEVAAHELRARDHDDGARAGRHALGAVGGLHA